MGWKIENTPLIGVRIERIDSYDVDLRETSIEVKRNISSPKGN